MRFLVFPLLVTAVIATDSGQVCEPGRTFHDYCNTCKCSDDGTEASCTRMYCPPDFFNQDGSLKVPMNDFNSLKLNQNVATELMTCKPGKIFKKYCNTCRCSDEGTAAVCTYMECTLGLYNEDGTLNDDFVSNINNLRGSHKSAVQSTMCQPGKVFKKDCNVCRCSKDGHSAACTYLNCTPGLFNVDASKNDDSSSSEDSDEQRHTISLRMKCNPGRVFKNSCNTCQCSTDGQSAACTMMLCPPGDVNEFSSGNAVSKSDIENFLGTRVTKSMKMMCKPGKLFKKSCNTCYCDKDGQSAACTLMNCPPGDVHEDTSESEVSNLDFETFLGSRVTRSTKMVCEPGKLFKRSCNTCHCDDDGQSAACTIMLCPPGDVNEYSSGNKVSKSDFENFLGTRVSKSTKMVCEPGKLFKKSCNTCHCDDDGQSAACTIMLCPPGDVNEYSSGNKVSKSDFENFLGTRVSKSMKMVCEPGKLFKNSCNTCYCDKDGQSAACTLMNCPPGYVDENASENEAADSYFQNFLRNHETKSKKMTCEPGKLFKQSCNLCYCDTDGQSAACTLMSCFPGHFSEYAYGTEVSESDFENFLERRETKSVTMTCEPGKRFKQSCNTCLCDEDGQSAACTLMDCPPGYVNEYGPRNDAWDSDFENFLRKYESKSLKMTCEPGRTFKKSCNTCKCSRDGLTAACTFMVCPPALDDNRAAMKILNESQVICEAGKLFQRACNTCLCSNDGKSAECTMMLCDV